MTEFVKPKRIYFFYVLAFAIPLLFFGLLEAGLRFFEYGDKLDLFIEAPSDYGNEAYLMNNPIVAQRYFPKHAYVPQPPHDVFQKNKPATGYRVFVMGGSTAATYPYPGNVLFSRLLNQRLSDAFPDKHIEVINTGIAAVNSFTLLDFIDEVLAHEPDAILIYAGHNEFYGALGAASSQFFGQSRWLVNGYLKLLKLKLVQLVRNTVNGLTYKLSANSKEPHETLMGRMVGDPHIPYGSDTYRVAKTNYEANLRDIIKAAKSRGVQVLISELVSNVKHHRPFVSVDDGVHLPADVVYAWAQMLEQEQMYEMAREAYVWAKDLDGLRFRAPEEFNGIIRKVAAEFNVPVVPMTSYFEKTSPHGIVGNNLMLEHLHPNVEGYYLFSEAFFDGMRQHGFIGEAWDDQNILPAAFYRRVWPITDLDKALGEIRIINLTDYWPYPPKVEGERSIATFMPHDEAEALAFKVFQQKMSYVQAHVELAEHYDAKGKGEQAFREYQAIVAASPGDVNAALLAIRRLLKLKEYDRAFPLLLTSREIKNTVYANKWIGYILMKRRQPQQALLYLEEALSLSVGTVDDPALIASAGLAYLLLGKMAESEASLERLKIAAPDSPGLRHLEGLIEERKQLSN